MEELNKFGGDTFLPWTQVFGSSGDYGHKCLEVPGPSTAHQHSTVSQSVRGPFLSSGFAEPDRPLILPRIRLFHSFCLVVIDQRLPLSFHVERERAYVSYMYSR